MKTKNLSDVKFYPETRKGINENLPVYAYFSYEGKRLKYYTGERIDREKWDEATKRVKRNVKQGERTAAKINKRLDNVAMAIYSIYEKYQTSDKPLSVSVFKNEIKQQFGEAPEKTTNGNLSDVMVLFIETSGGKNEWSQGTIAKFMTIKKHLIAGIGDIPLTEISFDSFAKMQKYFHKQEMVNSTIKKHLKLVKWFFNWLVKQEYITGKEATRIANYKPDLKDVKEDQRQEMNLIALTRDEIQRVKNLNIPAPKQYLERVRDVFLFQCFTGIRYSDVYNLKKSNIKQQPDGSFVLDFISIKDTDHIKFKLIPPAIEIYKKYKDTPGDRALPVVTNQRMNEYLKELGKLAGLNDTITKTHFRRNKSTSEQYSKWQLLTTHVGRKTFITTAVEAGTPMPVLMQLVGHSDIKMLRVYYTIRDEKIAKTMDKIGGYYG